MPTNAPTKTPTRMLPTHTTLAAGQEGHFLEITPSGLWGWGKNSFGQLGLGDSTNKPTPQPVTSFSSALSGDPFSVCAGTLFACVLDDEGAVACSGADQLGQLGVGANRGDTNALLAVPIGGGKLIAHLACGGSSVLATTTEGGLISWGRNVEGQLGQAHTTSPVWEVAVGFC
jgi:alpha-tubulin suppressor-like RCC1 family protein